MIPSIKHSEAAMPSNYKGGYHGWREDLVFNKFPSVFNEYRKLRNESMIARYLSTSRNIFLSTYVEDYFSDQDVHNFLYRDLKKIQQDLGFP